MCEGGDEGVLVDEAADLEREVEEGGLVLWGGCGWWIWGGARAEGGCESARSGCWEGFGLVSGCWAGGLRFGGLVLVDGIGDAVEKAEEVRLR